MLSRWPRQAAMCTADLPELSDWLSMSAAVHEAAHSIARRALQSFPPAQRLIAAAVGGASAIGDGAGVDKHMITAAVHERSEGPSSTPRMRSAHKGLQHRYSIVMCTVLYFKVITQMHYRNCRSLSTIC